MKFLARLGNAILNGRGRSNSIARRGSGGSVTDDEDADIGIGPEASAGRTASTGVPTQELVDCDAALGGNDGAGVTACDKVKGVAASGHAVTHGGWGSDAVPWGAGRGCGWCVADDRNTGVGVSPQAGAVGASAGVP